MHSQLADGNAAALHASLKQTEPAATDAETTDLAAENEQLKQQADELRKQIAQVKSECKHLRQEIAASGYRVVRVAAKTAFTIREKTIRSPGTKSQTIPARDFAEGEQVAVMLLKKDSPFTLQTFCEYIRDGYLSDAESVERRKANAAAPYAGDTFHRGQF